MTRRSVLAAGMAAAALLSGAPLLATGNLEAVFPENTPTFITNRVWHNNSLPTTWMFNNPATVAGCNYNAPNATAGNLQPAMNAAFNTWQNDLDSRASHTYGGTTTTTNIGNDGVNVVTFCDAGVLAQDLGFLASTPTTALTAQITVTAGGGCPAGQGILDANGGPPPAGFCFPAGTYEPGTLIGADIRFNTFGTNEQDFAINPNLAGFLDVQSTGTHEIGHWYGLSHDPVWQTVMFAFIDDNPSADGAGGQRVLKRGDLRTIGHYYPEATFGTSYGSITGFISLDGVDADGVHVAAIDPNTMLGVAGAFSITRFEDPNAVGGEGADFAANGAGFYRIDGLPAGNYYVHAEYFDNGDWFSGRMGNRYNSTVGNSNVANGAGAGSLGFLPQLAEFYDAAESANGGDGVNPGVALDNSDVATLVPVVAGSTTSNINIAINIETGAGTPSQRQNPTTRSVVVNDNFQGTDLLTAFILEEGGGNDDFWAVRFPAASLPTPPYNIAEGKWVRGGRATANFTTRLAFRDPVSPTLPDMANPVVPSAGRFLSGGPAGRTAAVDFVDVRDQWNVTVTEPRDVWVLLNQPEQPFNIQFITQGFFAMVTCVRDPNNQCTPTPRIGRTTATFDGGASWLNTRVDLLYDLILEQDPPVMITSAVPASMSEGQTGNVIINGFGFQNGATVDFGPNITVNTVTHLSAQQLQANITIATTGATADRMPSVKVTNPGVLFPNVARVFTVLAVMDSDGDGTPNLQDCSPFDPTLESAPGQLVDLDVTGAATSTLSWVSQDATAGSATVYDVVTGLIGDLAAAGDYGAATCAVNGHPDTPFMETSTPAPGAIRYWLGRARNGCGVGSYGDSTETPDPRDDLDSASPCL